MYELSFCVYGTTMGIQAGSYEEAKDRFLSIYTRSMPPDKRRDGG
jgi:hypothetical protein